MRKNLIDRLWLPAVLGLSTVVFSLVLMQRQLAQQQADGQAATKAQVLFVKNKMESELKLRIQPLQLLGDRWRSRKLNFLDANEMESDAVLAMSGYPAYQAIEWADPELRLRWVAPQGGNVADLGVDPGADPRLRQLLHAAADSGRVMVSHAVDLRQGGRGLLVCIPVSPNLKRGGFLVGVLGYQDLLDPILRDVAPGYGVAVYDGDEDIYSRTGAAPPLKEAPAQGENIKFQQLTWRAQVWPAPEKAVSSQSVLPQVTLMGGLVMATWIGLAAYAAGTERFRAKEVAAANEELKREIAGRKQAEEALIEAQTMEAVGRLAGGVAPDFNNMLMVIRGHATLLLSRLSPESPQRTEVSEIVKTTGRASSLTRQLLALGRKQVLKPRVLSLNALVIQVAELLPPVLGGDIRVIMDLDPDLGRVRADASQIEQIIMNLVFNARDAMSEGGELTVRTANADLDESWVLAHPEVRPGPHVMLAVHDTGCGMDRETQSHVFEPFFTTKDQSQGSGLGLATVYGTVHQSGGCVTISSTLGEGTAIQIYLPRVEEAIEEVEAPQGLSRPLRGIETIRVVEDDDAVRRMTREFLLIEGYTIVEARSAAEAMDLLQDNNRRVDLVLTDVIMPGMKGSELGESLAKLDSSIRVLYMSAYTEEAVVNFGFLGSGAAFIEKPFSPDELARKVREVLGAKRDSPRDASRARYASEAS